MSEITLEHTTKFRVRFVDTDKMGIVYNGNYLSFFETGRNELMRNAGLPYTVVEKNGYMLPLIDSYAKYINPAKYDDLLNICAKLNYSEGIKIIFNYNIFVNDTTITTGYTRHVFVKKENMTPVRPPKLFLDTIRNIK